MLCSSVPTLPEMFQSIEGRNFSSSIFYEHLTFNNIWEPLERKNAAEAAILDTLATTSVISPTAAILKWSRPRWACERG